MSSNSVNIHIYTGTSTRREIPLPEYLLYDDTRVNMQVSTEPFRYTDFNTFMNRNYIFPDYTALDVTFTQHPNIHTYFNNPYMENITDILMSSLEADGTLRRDPMINLDIEHRPFSQEDTVEKCSICQVEFELEDTISTLVCNHIFHNSCIVEWGKYKATCPLCNRVIPVIQR